MITRANVFYGEWIYIPQTLENKYLYSETFFFSLILTLSVVIQRDKSFAKWHIQNPSVWTSEVVWDISVVWLLLSISSPACPGLDLHYWRRKKSERLEGTSLCSYSFFFYLWWTITAMKIVFLLITHETFSKYVTTM